MAKYLDVVENLVDSARFDKTERPVRKRHGRKREPIMEHVVLEVLKEKGESADFACKACGFCTYREHKQTEPVEKRGVV